MSNMKHNTISRSAHSAHADKQLLRTPAPQPDESLMGYILRLSETNYCGTPKWVLDLGGLKIHNLKEGWRKLCDDGVDFTLFKQIARLSEEEVNEMKHEFIRSSDYEQCHAQWHVPISSLRFDWPMICPDCLRENPYCRKFWDLQVVTVCPQHHSLLLDICPSCQKLITWNRKSVSRCSCGCDWRETRFPELPPAQQRAMRLLMRSWEEATRDPSSPPFEQLGFGDLSRVMLCLARFVSVGGLGMDTLRMENRLLHQALEQVVAILDDWPEKFHRICDQYRYPSDLATRLDRLADRPSLMFLRIAMEEHWKVGQRSSSVYDLSLSRRFIPMEEAGERRSAASVSDPQNTALEVEALLNLYQSIEEISSPTSQTAIGLLYQGNSAELMNAVFGWLYRGDSASDNESYVLGYVRYERYFANPVPLALYIISEGVTPKCPAIFRMETPEIRSVFSE
jgi:hypothetical protein